jgi:hypothetical protein
MRRFPLKSSRALSTFLLAALGTVLLHAHHGAGQEDWAIWDRQIFEVCGVVEKAEWVNPHVLVHVSFTTTNGVRATWTFTNNAPHQAMRLGFTRQTFGESFAPGARVLAQGFSMVGTANRARARTIIPAQGQPLTDLSHDSQATVPPTSPRMACRTPADTRANVMPRTISRDEWQRLPRR